MENNKFTIPGIIFFGLILISYMALKLSATISVVISLIGFLIAYFLTSRR